MFVWQYNVHLFAVPFPAFRFNSDQGNLFSCGLGIHFAKKSPFGNLNIYGCRFFVETSFVIVKAFIYLEI